MSAKSVVDASAESPTGEGESPTWRAVARVDDIPLRGSRRIVHGDAPIALFRTRDDRVFALVDRCPHAGGPLSEGIVHDGCVTCPLHGFVISLETGEAQGADEGATRTLPVKVVDREVWLGRGVASAGPASAESSVALPVADGMATR